MAKIGIGLHGLELSYEFPLSEKFSIDNSLGAGMGMTDYGAGAEYLLDVARPTPYMRSRLKYIYNIEKRVKKNKNTKHNSGNYIAAQVKYSFGNIKTYQLNRALLTEVHWGIQRDLGGNFLFNMHIGLGYLQDFQENAGDLSPTLGFQFSYIMF